MRRHLFEAFMFPIYLIICAAFLVVGAIVIISGFCRALFIPFKSSKQKKRRPSVRRL